MFNLQAQNDRLALLTGDVIEEKNARFRGIAKVPIDDLVFAPEFMPCDYNISPAKVSRLKRVFRTEGCNQSEPANFILGTINQSILSEALQLSQLTLDDLQDSESPRMLYLPRFQYIRCANGRSRAATVLDTPSLGTWWTVELYAEDVKEFQLRVPGVSQVDYCYLAGLIKSGVAFKRLSNTAERSQLLHRIKDIKYLLPSIYTLQKDFKYLRLCTDTMKRLLCGKMKMPFTVQALAYEAFAQKAPIGPNDQFFVRLKRLYIYIMRDLVELTGEWPLLEDGEESPEVCFRHPENWHRLAKEARRLGFESDEIKRLASENPDEQVALKALHDARPSSLYEYNQSELQGILNRIVYEFDKASARVFEDSQSTFTTIGTGEPITRRGGRQYSGAYNRDRWSFNLAQFSRPTANSKDITSLFVRKSVFHAFWRLDEDQDGDKFMLQPIDSFSPSARCDSLDSSEASADVETHDETMTGVNNESIQSDLAVQPQTRPEQSPMVQKQLQRRGTDTPQQLSEGSVGFSPSVLDMIVPFGQDAEMQILQHDGTGWRARFCRRGSISRVIGDVKSQLGEIDFYHQEGRAIAEHEMSQY
ncbi:intracellular protein transport protein uso1 [Fusarium flagelliforme]|uniref:Intracellular protein transport protein uso1 n=1 Tax=Fusarium flagelliforme TaxID=2675880 RepID=A0A395MIU3_9HYPO|nr:intracellular protein transport protein uso1 [Fusarium flagelliforme]